MNHLGEPRRKKAGRWNGQSALDLGPMCDAEKDWHERSLHPSDPVQSMATKNLLSTRRKWYFLSLFLSYQQRTFKGLFIVLALNSILFWLLEYHLRIFVVSCSNLSEIRQCRMQECPAYHDQVVFRFSFPRTPHYSNLNFISVEEQ